MQSELVSMLGLLKKILEKYKEPTPDALVESASHHIKILEDNDFSILR